MTSSFGPAKGDRSTGGHHWAVAEVLVDSAPLPSGDCVMPDMPRSPRQESASGLMVFASDAAWHLLTAPSAASPSGPVFTAARNPCRLPGHAGDSPYG